MRITIATGLLYMALIGVAVVAPIADAQNRSSGHAAAKAPDRATKFPAVGHTVRTVPQGHQTIRVNRQSYRYHNGSFYRPGPDGRFAIVYAPRGARVRSLAPGYVSFGIGPRRYFYVNYTYYVWDRQHAEYVVIDAPEGAESELVSASQTTSGEIFVYPNRGQSDEERDRDRYECYVWASGQTGYDPTADAPGIDKAGDYRRAISACLEGRGYTVK